MSIASELTRLQSAKASIKSAIEEKLGDEVPDNASLSEYSTYVTSAADVQYLSGVAAGGGGADVGSNVVICSNGTVIDSGTMLANKGIAGSEMQMHVSNGGIATNAVVVDGASAIVSSGGKLTNPSIYASVVVSSNGSISGGRVDGNNALISAFGTVSNIRLSNSARLFASNGASIENCTLETSGQLWVSGSVSLLNNIVVQSSGILQGSAGGANSAGAISSIDGGYVDIGNLTVDSLVFSGARYRTEYNPLRVNESTVIHNLIANQSSCLYPEITSGATVNYLNKFGGTDPIKVMNGGNVQSCDISNDGTVEMLPGGSISNVNVSGGALMIKGSAVVSNVNIYNSGGVMVYAGNESSGANINGINVYTSSASNPGYGGSFEYGCALTAVDICTISDAVIHPTASAYIASGALLVEPVVSSGGKIIFGASGSASYIDAKDGAIVVVSANGTSSTISDDYNENNCNITFVSPPRVTVNYIGAGSGYMVSGISEPSGMNGMYVMYNGDPNKYKHISSNYYLLHATMYGDMYMIADYPTAQEYYEAYYVNYTSFVSSNWENTYNYATSGTPVVTLVSTNPIGAWSIDNGLNWNGYGSSVLTGDAKGSLLQRTITFSSISGYVSPSSITAIMYDRNNVFEAQYMILLTVTITNVNGAQWSIDGGTTWNNSGASIQVPANSHQTITYNSVSVDGVAYTHESQSIDVTLSANNVSVEYIENPGTGTLQDPYLWSAKVDSTIGNTLGCHTIQFSAKGRDSSQAIYLKVYLTSGTTYSFGADSGSDPFIYLATLSGDIISQDDDGGGSAIIDGHQLSAENNSYCSYISYTPSESGYYLIGGANSEGSTIRLHCSPAPIPSGSNSNSGSSSESQAVGNYDLQVSGINTGESTYDNANGYYVCDSGTIGTTSAHYTHINGGYDIHYDNGNWVLMYNNDIYVGDNYVFGIDTTDIEGGNWNHGGTSFTVTLLNYGNSNSGGDSNSEASASGFVYGISTALRLSGSGNYDGVYTYDSTNNWYYMNDVPGQDTGFCICKYTNWYSLHYVSEGTIQSTEYSCSDSDINGTHTWDEQMMMTGETADFTITDASSESGGGGGGTPTINIASEFYTGLVGDYVLQEGNANDTTGVWYNSDKGKYLFYYMNNWCIYSNTDPGDPTDANWCCSSMENATITDPTTWNGIYANGVTLTCSGGSSSQGGGAETYYYTVSGAPNIIKSDGNSTIDTGLSVNGNYSLYSGTHGSNDAIYTNGEFYLVYSSDFGIWGISRYSSVGGVGPGFWDVYEAPSSGGSTPTTGIYSKSNGDWYDDGYSYSSVLSSTATVSVYNE